MKRQWRGRKSQPDAAATVTNEEGALADAPKSLQHCSRTDLWACRLRACSKSFSAAEPRMPVAIVG